MPVIAMQRNVAVLLLVVSIAVAVGVLVYAFSLDEWGDTGGVVFPIVFVAAIATAAASAVSIARSSKRR